MANVCSRCSARLTFRNHFVYQGKDLCRDCLGVIDAEGTPEVPSASSSSGGAPDSTVVNRYETPIA